jgi:chromosomal replication initiation ATPase DnaA
MRQQDLDAIAGILGRIEREMGVPAEILISQQRNRSVSTARNAAIYCISLMLPHLTDHQISRVFRKKDRTSVHYAITSIVEVMDRCPEYSAKVGRVLA